MTNAPLDIQPALRPLNVLVRGGRLTRFKGRVASIAPGLSVVTTAAVLAGAADQAAAQACGAVVNGQVICDAGDSTANGITYNTSGTDDFSLVLDDPDIEVGGSGVKVNGASGSTGEIFMHLKDGEVAVSSDQVRGIWGTTQGRGGVTVQMDGGRVDTTGEFGTGLWAEIANNSIDDATRNEAIVTAVMTGGVINTGNRAGHALLADHKGLGAAEALVSGGKITTSGVTSNAVWANVGHAQSTGRALASVTGGAEITTIKANSDGVYVNNSGLGEATAYLQDSAVTTFGNSSHGLDALTSSDSTARASSIVLRGNVTTHGRLAQGLAAVTGGLGAATVHLEDGAVTTLGYGAEGLWAQIVRAGSAAAENTATSEVRVINGTVLTKGEAANALFATHGGSGDSIVRAFGNTTITTEGKNSHGLAASAYGAGKAIVELGAGAVVRVYGENAVGLHAEGGTGFDVDVAGEVTGGAGEGAAIRAFFLGSPPSDASGTIDIASTGKVTAGSSGYAIQVNGTGAAVITSAGTITGDIRFGAGNDTLTLTGGSFTGDLYAGDGDDTVTISAATEFDSSNILDGGAGDDRLTLHGQTLTTMENLRNWEHLTLTETELSLEGVGTLEAGLSIEAGSEFRVTGGGRGAPTGAAGAGRVASASGEGMTIRGDVINAGDVTLSVQDGVTGDVITIDGDYTNTGSGRSAFVLDTVLEGAGFATDRLEITGATSGEIGLSLAGLDSAGAEVTELEIDVVSVGGASDGTFRLMEGNHVTSDGEHGVIAGAYLYRLAETAGGWALSAQSEDGAPIWQPAAPIHESYGASLLSFNASSALRERGSSQDFRSLAWGGNAAGQDTGSPLWIRMGTEQLTSSEENSTTGAARDSSIWEMEVGADLVLSESGAGLFVGGLMLSYGTGSTDVSSDFGDGSIDTKGLGLGLAATWYDTRGFYVDGQASLASYTSDLSSDRLGSLTEGNSGTGYALSLEAGQRLDLGARLAVIPQAQLSVSSVGFEDFTSESVGEERVSLDEAMSQQLRLGLEFEPQDQGASGLYGLVNLYHDFGAGSTVGVAGASLTTESEPWALGVGVGGRYAWSDRVDFFGEAAYATGLSTIGDTSALSASAGLKVVF